MASTIRKIEQNKYELMVELGKEELSGYVKIAEDRIAQEVKVDGFRKGKAPKDKIRQEVGQDLILQEALDIAVQSSLSKAIEEEKLDVIKVSDLAIKENSATKLLYSVNILVSPPVKINDLSGLKIKKREVSVDRKDIDEALEYVVASRSKFIAQDKPVEKGDRVEVDFEVTYEGLPIEGGVSKNHPLIIGDNKFIPGFEDKLIGMKKDEEKRFELNAPTDYGHKAIAGKKLDFVVKVITVQKIEKPLLNNDFAKAIGNFQSVNELEQNISQGILREKTIKEQQRLRVEILTNIYEKSKIELPEDMVAEKLNEMIAGFDNELHSKGMELSIYLAHLGKTQDDLKKDWRKEAEKQTSFGLILKKIARDQNIKAAPEEVNMAMEQFIQSVALRGGMDNEQMDMEGIRESIAGNLINEKVFNYLETTYVA